MRLSERTILITGGTSGIGLELATQLIRRGNTVAITGRDAQKLAAAKRLLPGVHTFVSDVADPNAIAALHGNVLAKLPALDILINNAGIMRKMNLHTFAGDLNNLATEIETNLTGPVRMVMQFLPILKSRDSSAIVNVTSGLAFNPYPIAPLYGATKAGLHSFTQSLRVQLKQTNVKVFELAPPAVDTPLNFTFAEELQGLPLMNVGKLVNEALKGLEKDRLEIRVGFANVSKLLSRVAPGFILKQLSKPVDKMLTQMKQLPR